MCKQPSRSTLKGNTYNIVPTDKIKKSGHLQCWKDNNNVGDSLVKTLADQASTRRPGRLWAYQEPISKSTLHTGIIKMHITWKCRSCFMGYFTAYIQGSKKALLGDAQCTFMYICYNVFLIKLLKTLEHKVTFTH